VFYWKIRIDQPGSQYLHVHVHHDYTFCGVAHAIEAALGHYRKGDEVLLQKWQQMWVVLETKHVKGAAPDTQAMCNQYGKLLTFDNAAESAFFIDNLPIDEGAVVSGREDRPRLYSSEDFEFLVEPQRVTDQMERLRLKSRERHGKES
jgi:hypothetical protein